MGKGNKSKSSVSLRDGTIAQRTDRDEKWYYYSRSQKTRISLGTKNRDEAIKIATEIEARNIAVESGLISTRSDGSGKLLGEIAFEYANQRRGELSDSYFKMVLSYIEQFIKPYFRIDKPIEEITTPKIVSFGQWLIAEKGLSSVTGNKVLSTLSKILKFSVENGWIDQPPMMKWLRMKKKEHGYALSINEIESLIHAARILRDSDDFDRRYQTMINFVALGLFCGLRHREILSVKWEDIDWDNKIIHLKDQKNQTLMPAPFLRRARIILEETPDENRIGYVCHYLDSNVKLDSRKKGWKKLLTLAGLDGFRKPDGGRITPHDMRHTFVTEMKRKLQYGAMPLSRHKDPTAFDRYDHITVISRIGEVDDAFMNS